MILFHLLLLAGLLYVMLFLFYWKWKLIYKYVFNDEMRERWDHDMKWLFRQGCILFGVKFKRD